MRCHGSICRWSPFFGICLSKSIAASGCTTNGANDSASITRLFSAKPCQCASSPSPRHDTMPMPVIQASRGASAIRQRFHRKSDPFRHLFHGGAQSRVGERHDAERELRLAGQLSVDGDRRFRHGEARSLVQHLGVDREQLAGNYEGAQLRLLDGGEERHALELGGGQHEPARGLRHRLDQQHARHQRMPGEMPFEDRAFLRNLGIDADRAPTEIEVDDAVDELEILDSHDERGYAPLAATSPSMRAHRFLRTKYCSVVALPSLTSCVHCSSGSLMPNALSIANAMSRKSRLSMPRSSIAWLSGWIFSRGISQVSAMILATVSKVEDIINSLGNLKFGRRAGRRANPPGAGPGRPDQRIRCVPARIAKWTCERNAALRLRDAGRDRAAACGAASRA